MELLKYERPPFGAAFSFGRTKCTCITCNGPFAVGDLDQLAERLRAAGAPVEYDDAIPGLRRFYTVDAVGNRIEFLEES